MAFYQFPTFEDWLKSTDFESRFSSIKGTALMAAKEAWTAARQNEPPKPREPVKVLTEEEWLDARKEDGMCGCAACWSRYINYYGPRG